MNTLNPGQDFDEWKDTQKGVELTCREMEKIYSEGMESGEKHGIEKGELKTKKKQFFHLLKWDYPLRKSQKL